MDAGLAFKWLIYGKAQHFEVGVFMDSLLVLTVA